MRIVVIDYSTGGGVTVSKLKSVGFTGITLLTPTEVSAERDFRVFEKADLIILEIYPIKNDLSMVIFLRALRNAEINTPVIVFTIITRRGLQTKLTRTNLNAMDIAKWVLKPYLEKLLEAIKDIR